MEFCANFDEANQDLFNDAFNLNFLIANQNNFLRKKADTFKKMVGGGEGFSLYLGIKDIFPAF